MKFQLPHQDIDFEIPDEWLVSVDAYGFSPKCSSFTASSDDAWPTSFVSLVDVEAPVRSPGVRWFDEARMISVMKGMIQGNTLPPLEADEPPKADYFRYRVRDGFHRYYASAALGFKLLPVSLRPYFNLSDLG